mmetsp:Transcript_20158/g.32643  ORF Transcript_20158/g.32643 Transcript_20158/m.32643 type:complete len:207 (+) Transcript_20158:212-832(+)
MTIAQLTFQPFGILNAMRERFVIPLATTCLLRVALFSPKDTNLYRIFGTSQRGPPSSPGLTGQKAVPPSPLVFNLHIYLYLSLFLLAAGLIVMLAVATMAFSVVYYVLLETDTFGKLRSVFDSRPWRNRESVYTASPPGSPAEHTPAGVKTKSMCPFSKKAAKGICPICSSCTSRDGYHHVRKLDVHRTCFAFAWQDAFYTGASVL